MDELENSCAFSKRLYVPPTYAELRKIVNIAQVQALQLRLQPIPLHFPLHVFRVIVLFSPAFSAQAHAGARRVKMLTFDADDTLFPGGCSLSENDWVVDAILTFLRKGSLQQLLKLLMLPVLFCHSSDFPLRNTFQAQILCHHTFTSSLAFTIELHIAGLMVAVVTAAGYPGADGARKFVFTAAPDFLFDYDSLSGMRPGFVVCLMQ